MIAGMLHSSIRHCSTLLIKIIGDGASHCFVRVGSARYFALTQNFHKAKKKAVCVPWNVEHLVLGML